MYGTEDYIAWFLIFICSYATARVLVSCFVEPFIHWVKGSYNNWKEKKTHQITIEEIQDFLSQVDFENMVREYAEGLHDNDPTPDPNLVTPEEAKMFHDWYLKFTKYLESNKNTQEV